TRRHAGSWTRRSPPASAGTRRTAASSCLAAWWPPSCAGGRPCWTASCSDAALFPPGCDPVLTRHSVLDAAPVGVHSPAMRTRSILVAALAVLLAMFLAACGGDGSSSEDDD